MSRSRDNADAVTTVPSGVGRNMVINGGMNVSQRGTSLTMAHDGVQSGYLLDRFGISMGGNQETFDGAYSQASDGPNGVSANSILWTTGTAESAVAADEIFYIYQVIEAQNCQRLSLGTSASKQVTLSFYVNSSITGTYGVSIYKPDAAGGLTVSIVTGTYTISSADTWERKTITFPSGTASSLGITDDNGQGLFINWHLQAGSDYTATDGTSWGDYATGKWAFGHAQNGVVTTAGATWGITGVQMEVGPVATEFEQEDISVTLDKCKRYCQDLSPPTGTASPYIADGYSHNATVVITVIHFSEMRATPTLTLTGTPSDYTSFEANTSRAVTAVAANGMSSNGGGINFTVSSGLTAGRGNGVFLNADITHRSILEAEL